MRGVKNWNRFTPEDIPDEFWSLVDLSKNNEDAFTEELRKLTQGSLIRFAWLLREGAALLQNEAHLRHVAPGLSEDALDDLFLWVMMQGKDFYTDVFYHPERTPSSVDARDPSLRVLGAAEREYRSRYNQPIPAR